MNAAAQEYLSARVMTASPQSLHLLVVEGAIRHATRAQQSLAAGDHEAAWPALGDARSFVRELITGLNESVAPDIVANLTSLFTFAYRRLAEAELHNSAEKIEDALRVLRLHRETWTELMNRLAESPTRTSTDATPAVQHSRSVPSEYDDYQPRSWSG